MLKNIWTLKNKGINFNIEWGIIEALKLLFGICNLCLEEKLVILHEKQMNGSNILNKRLVK